MFCQLSKIARFNLRGLTSIVGSIFIRDRESHVQFDTIEYRESSSGQPLLDFSDLPRFGDIKPEHVTPALDVLLADAKAAVDHASAPETPATWRDIVESVERASERLSRAWGVIGHLNAVADTPELRAAHAENLPRVTEFSASVGQNLALYEKYKAIAGAKNTHRFQSSRRKC